MIGDILCENVSNLRDDQSLLKPIYIYNIIFMYDTHNISQIPRMSAYIRFCSCQISAAMYLQRLTETSPEFVRVAQTCQQDPRTKGMPLSSFLIKPMQRITKYPLIIGKVFLFLFLDNYSSHHIVS